jgi:hypothetical protein
MSGQLGLIFWLGKPREAVRPAQADLAPLLQLTRPEAAQNLVFSDPTLFALPHRESFSGPAWLIIPVREFPAIAWSPPPQFLDLPDGELGGAFQNFMATNHSESLPAIAQPELTFKLPVVQERPALPGPSRLLLAGALAQRNLLVVPELPSWPSSDILTNTVVQLLVGPDGESISATLLAKSGSDEADQRALAVARGARFNPVSPRDPGSTLEGLALGQAIFKWHTVPLANTNSPAESSFPKQ